MRLKGFIIDVVIGVSAIVAVLSLSMATPLGIYNAKLVEAFTSVSLPPAFTPITFTIKNTDKTDLAMSEVNTLVRELVRADAAHIIILDNDRLTMSAGHSWPPNVYLASAQRQNAPVDSPHSLRLFELKSNNGNYLLFRLESSENSLISLLNESTVEAEQPLERFFNFAVRPSLLPHITTQQALNGDIIRSLVGDKIVFLQVSPSHHYERFHVSDTQKQEALSYVEMQALATETVAHNLNLKAIPFWVTAIGLLFAYFAAFFLLQLLSGTGVLIFETLQLATALVLAYLLFVGFQLVFPFGELVLTQAIALLQFLFSERQREGRILSSRTAKLQARLNRKMLPVSFLQAEDPWKNLHAFIDQNLHMQRSILLDRLEQDHRLVAINSINCTVDDIEERRRDFQRSPFSDAIQTQKPHRMRAKHFFKDTTEQEIEYIVPLMFAGDVLGFWALTVEPDENWNENTFVQNLLNFARELSELLYHRSKFKASIARENRWLHKIINLNYAANKTHQLDATTELLERRLGLLQNIFNRNSSALVLYNLFGQVLTSNHKMDRIAQALDLKFFTMSAHDLLVDLTGEKSEKIKSLILQITLHHRAVEWTISSPKLESDYILRVLPIERETTPNQEVSPFSLAGILFEFVDVHSVQQVVKSTRELQSYYFDALATDFAQIKKITTQLTQDSDAAQSEQLHRIDEILNKQMKLSNTVENMMDIQQHSNEVFPINSTHMVENCVRKHNKALELKAIKINYQCSDIQPLAMVSVEQTKQLIDTILSLLIEDSDTTQGEITVHISSPDSEDERRRIELRFANKGYGVPQERLESLHKLTNIELFSERNDLFTVLYLGRQIREWGAELKLSSKLGEGFQLELSLPTFEANMSHPEERPTQ